MSCTNTFFFFLFSASYLLIGCYSRPLAFHLERCSYQHSIWAGTDNSFISFISCKSEKKIPKNRHLENILERHLLLGNSFHALDNENPSLFSALSEVYNREVVMKQSQVYQRKKRHLSKTQQEERLRTASRDIATLASSVNQPACCTAVAARGEGQRGPAHEATSAPPQLLI